jgi:energy-coupling factor transport system ATP-binding protein
VDLIAEYADEVLVLHRGSLVRKGKVDEVLRDEALLKYGVQLPQIALLSNELIRRGLPLGEAPITEDAAVEALQKFMGGR